MARQKISSGSKFAILENDVGDQLSVKNKSKKNTQVNNKVANNNSKKKEKKNQNQNQNQNAKQQESKIKTNNDKIFIAENDAKKFKTKTITFSSLPNVNDSRSLHSESCFKDSKIQVIYLWSISAIYFFAFFSFYWQIRGLYGEKGVLPLRYYAAQFSKNNRTVSFDELYQRSPSLVWLLSNYGFSLTTCLELLTLSGLIVSFLQLFFKPFRSFPNYIFLYLTYFSLVKVGQTFLYFQWDSLLLETGVVTILVALRSSQLGFFAPDSDLVMWPVKWLLFKFMFSSGVVKLTSRCSLWWSLRALDVHFESQCLPTPVAWFAHQLPHNWLALGVVITYFIEIIVPFFFFVPILSFKMFSFYSQVFLQILIILTGNYNFFNLLTIALCFGLLKEKCHIISGYKESMFYAVTVGFCTYFIDYYFDISFDNVDSFISFFTVGPTSKVNFTLDQFNLFLTQAITLSIWIGCLSFIYVSIAALLGSFYCRGLFNKFIQLLSNLLAVVLCGFLLAASIVPLAELDTSGDFVKNIPNSLKRLNTWTLENMMVNSYGLFRVMTGENGRPEIIIEGTNDPQNDKWRPYHFVYKPGDLQQSPRFNLPYQPRLDWQMWFAALGNYQSNPWLLNLCFRILSHEPDVLALLDKSRLPFPIESPPKYIRISRYTYEYTTDFYSKAWWNLKSNRQAYMPVVNKDTIIGALKLEETKLKVPGWIEKLSVKEKQNYSFLKVILDAIYNSIILQTFILPGQIMLTVFVFAFYIQLVRCNRSSKSKL